ncbi:MAG: hypothetical protein ACSHXF_11790 [Aquaticitalea sp.]
MKSNHKIFILIVILTSHYMMAQKLSQPKVESLTEVLNSNLAPNFQVELRGNKAYCTIDELSNTLDLRNEHEMATDSIVEKSIKRPKDSGPHTGPVFWIYDFKSVTSSKVHFKTTPNQQLFCSIFFENEDSIGLKTRLNAYSSNHKISDSALHEVEWTGEKYISFLLTPEQNNTEIKLSVSGITVSGKFERKDRYDLSKNYTKELRSILRREFKKLFESEEMTQLITQTYND